jgi:adenine C2-methylase RlmN of 23S rRNA A2503 and tRNA A37
MWTPFAAAIKAAAQMPAMLAWSVHAADEAVRQKLVPTTAHSMLELRDAYLKAHIRKSPLYGIIIYRMSTRALTFQNLWHASRP